MRIRDKIITAACLTPDSIEWTTLKVKQDGTEPVEQGTLPIPERDVEAGPAALATVQLADEIGLKLEGDLTASIRTSELLMRTMEFPTAEPIEIASMIGFQIDKISPFPLDQLAVSYEILKPTETGALVLMVGVRRDCIDAIGDTFGQKGIHIHSIDARILGWLQLLEKGEHLSGSGSEILVVDDGVDFVMVVLHDGAPISFRSMPYDRNDKDLAAEIAGELAYTLTTLDTEHELPAPESIAIWSWEETASNLVHDLGQKTGMKISRNSLATLPPLSEGIIERALRKKNRIELIPREWIEHEKNKEIKKKFVVYSSSIGAVWLVAVLALTIVYQTRASALNKVQKIERELAPAANQAIENRSKLRALKNYADRSDSALECLREATLLLPPGDIEFVSYNYNDGKIALRGTAADSQIVYSYFDALADSGLFVQLQDQRIDTKTTRGVQRAVFNINLLLPTEEAY